MSESSQIKRCKLVSWQNNVMRKSPSPTTPDIQNLHLSNTPPPRQLTPMPPPPPKKHTLPYTKKHLQHKKGPQ